MDILVKGMKMPSSCPKCDFCSLLSSKYTITNIPYCELIGTEVSPYEKDKDCPLVEVDASFKRFAEIAEEAGIQGKEAKFRINGRLFAVRELPQ